MTVYDRTDTGIAAGIDAAYHAGFVAMMEQNFGPYPFGADLRVLVAPTYWAGFEHPGNIVIDDSLKKVQIGSAYASPLAHTLDHEIAHQWAGDQTTIADTYDFVWKESMAEYLAFVYEASVDPAIGLKTADAWKQFSVGAQYFPVPGEKPALFDYYGDVYGPGPMILFRQIEVLSSRANVITALQSVLGTPRALSVDEVVAALETSTGLDLGAYAAAWIHGTGAPVFPQVDVAVAVDATSVHVVQIVAPERRCKFHLALRGAQPTDELLVAVDTFTGGIDQTLAITPAFAVTNVVVDPLRECLMTAHAITAAPTNTPHRNPWLAPQ
ncbi:MAG: M1 family aminopeptidase [Proteobacteria bacterium]|nr:M1 family aminopeptidase [Pseudomonadota bacterium]